MTKNLIISRLDENIYAMLRQNVDTVEEFKQHLEEIVHYGCMSGCVPQLIYTRDCIAFAQENIADIMNLMAKAIDEGILESIPASVELLVWRTVEITAMQLLNTIDWNYMLDRTVEAELITTMEEE